MDSKNYFLRIGNDVLFNSDNIEDLISMSDLIERMANKKGYIIIQGRVYWLNEIEEMTISKVRV